MFRVGVMVVVRVMRLGLGREILEFGLGIGTPGTVQELAKSYANSSHLFPHCHCRCCCCVVGAVYMLHCAV